MSEARTPLRKRSELTPRQQSVLALIAKGRTNAEIAAELGISFDTAKSHVAEILARLEVDSREEAADWWRRENGLRARLTRLIGVSVWSATGKVTMAVAAIGAAGIGALLIFMALGGSDDDTSSDADPTGQTASPTGTSPAAGTPGTATPSVSSTASPAGGSVVPQDFQAGSPIEFPPGVVLYWSWAGIEGPHQNLWRGFRDANGELVAEDLYGNLPDAPGGIAASAHDFATGRLAVLLCVSGYCGGYVQAEPDSEAVLVMSEDGGITWSEPAPVAPGWLPVVFVGDELLAIRYPNPGNDQEYVFELYPSGAKVAPPRGGYPTQLADGRVVFVDYSGDSPVYDLNGNVLFELPPLPPEASEGGPVLATPALNWARWNEGSTQYFGEVNTGSLTRIFRVHGAALYLQQPFIDGQIIGRADNHDQDTRTPIVVDLQAGAIHELTGLSSPPTNGPFFVAAGVEVGDFALALPGTGECLNVRTAPSSTADSVACVADRVLLELTGEEQSVDGTAWKSVRTPDGTEGWAASEFLR